MKDDTKYKWYNSGDSLGVVGVPIDKIAHQSGIYTLLLGYTSNYSWIVTSDLHNTREEAETATPAKYLR